MKTIGVIGCGVVGEAVAKGFEAKGLRVRRYDKFKVEINDARVLMECDTVFICVPTATREDGSVGYGGMCFPKDSLAQLTWAQDLGLDMEQLWGTVVGNKRRRKDIP